MTTPLLCSAHRAASRTLGSAWGLLPTLRWTRKHLPVGAAVAVFALLVTTALAPPPLPTPAQEFQAYLDANAQTVRVSSTVSIGSVARDDYSATPGIATLAASGTNYDWATLVLVMAGLPTTENNITVFTRWMRQENYVDSWWNRNNPLNNGWGSGGGGGLGSYDSLVIAAENAAEALRTNSGYSGIVAAFEASESTAAIEAAIWASPWASGHYAYGAHWAYFEVPVVKADPSAWG
ncbi:MAG: hypothetical protein ABL886_15275 [Rhodoglobus sp.]